MRLKAKQLTLGIKIVNKLDYEAKILETKKKDILSLLIIIGS